MRATTGGSPPRSLRSASTTFAHSTAINHVGIDCSGVAPPPITDSPATDDNFKINPSAPNWDYRVIYEVWIDFSTFKGHGYGGAYIPQVHASPSMAGTNTIDVKAATAKKVYVTNTPGKNSVAVAELAMGLILALDRRIPDKQTLVNEIAAWEHDRNAHHAKASWRFTTPDARIKLKHLYPSI